MADLATDCTADLAAKVATISIDSMQIDTEHTLTVYSEKDLDQKISQGIAPPFAGIMYGGIVALPGSDPSRMGRACDLMMGVLYGFSSKVIGGHDAQAEAWLILAAGRKALMGTKSPTGHIWRFRSEAFLGVRSNVLYYVQQWVTFTPFG